MAIDLLPHSLFECTEYTHLIHLFAKKCPFAEVNQTMFVFLSVRHEMLQENLNVYRPEITELHEQSQKMAATAQKHEQIIHTMTQDLRAANEKLAMAEVRRLRLAQVGLVKLLWGLYVYSFLFSPLSISSFSFLFFLSPHHQVRGENLKKERDMLKSAESRLSQEKEAMMAEQRNQNLLLTNLKSIQVHTLLLHMSTSYTNTLHTN